MVINVLVLGHKGLLGNMVHKYLSKKDNINVMTIDPSLRWPSTEFKLAVKESTPDFIVNCIGAIHQKTSEFSVNYELPTWLDSLDYKIIHPGTDCEMDNDMYGISKRTAREFIVTNGKNTRIIKTSIIGPELTTNYSLFNWFLSNVDGSKVNGFTDKFWNGNTTLTWAKICGQIIDGWQNYPVETILTTDCISKYELLCVINKVFNRNIDILPITTEKKDSCLTGVWVSTIKQQLYELRDFMYENS